MLKKYIYSLYLLMAFSVLNAHCERYWGALFQLSSRAALESSAVVAKTIESEMWRPAMTQGAIKNRQNRMDFIKEYSESKEVDFTEDELSRSSMLFEIPYPQALDILRGFESIAQSLKFKGKTFTEKQIEILSDLMSRNDSERETWVQSNVRLFDALPDVHEGEDAIKKVFDQGLPNGELWNLENAKEKLKGYSGNYSPGASYETFKEWTNDPKGPRVGIFVGHNEDGKFHFPNGDKIPLETLDGMTTNGKSALFVTCKAGNYIKDSAESGIKHRLTFYEGSELATQAIEKLKVSYTVNGSLSNELIDEAFEEAVQNISYQHKKELELKWIRGVTGLGIALVAPIALEKMKESKQG